MKQVSLFNCTFILMFYLNFVLFFIGVLHNLIENSVVDDDSRIPKKSWKG